MRWKRFQLGFLAVFCLTTLGCMETPNAVVEESPDPSQGFARIISLAPSITEILFALDLNERIVGVTQFCDFPAEARTRTSVGGYYNPNYEAMMTLKPDLVVLLKEHTKEREHFDALNIPWVEVNHHGVDNIFQSIQTIGETTGKQDKARELVRELAEKLERVRIKTQDLSRPRVLVSVGRNMGGGSIEDAYIAGQGSLFNELIELAGGINAYREGGRAYPVVSGEGLLVLDPDIIIDMVPHRHESGITAEQVRAEWSALPKLSAVQSGRVYVFDQDYVTIPGPRIFLLVEQMAQVMHPELFSGSEPGGKP